MYLLCRLFYPMVTEWVRHWFDFKPPGWLWPRYRIRTLVIMEPSGETDMLYINQTDLTCWIIESLGLDFRTKQLKWTSVELTPLVKYKGGKPPTGYLIYGSVVGIIIYFDRHFLWHFLYSFNCKDCYMLCEKHSHEL